MPKKSTAAKRGGSARRSKTTAPAAKKSAAKRRTIPAHRPANKDIHDKALREHVLYVLRGGGAHLDVEKALAELPRGLRGVKPAGVPFTAWTLLEHMRI